MRVTGTDGWSWDAPFSFTRKRFRETGDASIAWEGHKASREIGCCDMEKLTNLDQLPPFGFKVCCFPVKIAAASAGSVRAVACLDEEPTGSARRRSLSGEGGVSTADVPFAPSRSHAED